jgi:hypothetical protein
VARQGLTTAGSLAPPRGLLSARPSATGSGALYFATDDAGIGILYQDTAAGVWTPLSRGGRITYAENATGTAQTGLGGTNIDVPGVAITVPPSTLDVVLVWYGMFEQTAVGAGLATLDLMETTSGSTYRSNGFTPLPNTVGASSKFFQVQRSRYRLGAVASTRTFKLRASCSRDTASTATISLLNTADNPTFLAAYAE